MNLKEILLKVETMGDLPTLPEVVQGIRRVTEDERASAADLANVILEDSALASKVLRVVNSSFYSHYSGRVSTVTRAIVILGFTSVRDMAMGLRIQEVLSRVGDREQLKTFWTMSLASAICTKELAVRASYPSPEEAFIAGLLQNVGQVILVQCFPQEYPAVLQAVRSQGRLAAERERLRLDHAEVGGALAEHWHFPSNLETAIRSHHREGLPPNQRHAEPLVDLVYAGHLLASCLLEPAWHGTGPDLARVGAILEHLLGLKGEEAQPVLAMLPRRLEELAAKLSLAVSIPSVLLSKDPSRPPAAESPASGDPREEELALLHEISSAMVHGMALDPLLQLVAECAYRVSGLERVVLFVGRPGKGVIEGFTAFGFEGDPVHTLVVPAPRSGNRLHELLAGAEAVHLRRAGDPEILPESLRQKLAPKEFAMAALRLGGKVRGLFFADNPRSGKPITPEAAHVLGVFATQAALALGLKGRG